MSEPSYPVSTKNMQIWHMFQGYQHWLVEIEASTSKKGPEATPPDIERWNQNIAAMNNIMDTFNKMPPPDWAATHGRRYELTDPIYPTYEFKENLGVQTFIDMVSNARDELALSDSNDKPMHLTVHDEKRQRQYLTDMTTWITSFLEVTQPIDGPVTAALDALVLPDKNGA